MPDLDPDLSRRISDAARRVQIAKSMMERARNFDERKALQVELDAAEKEMQEVAMTVNRGLHRVSPSPR